MPKRGAYSKYMPSLRCVPPYEVAHYERWHYERLAALPGITGLWQVKGRCQLAFEDMIRVQFVLSCRLLVGEAAVNAG